MKKRILVILKYLIFLGIGVFLIWWSLHQIPDEKWGDFKLALATAKYWLIFPVFIILLVSHIFRAIRWKMLMKPLGFEPKLRNVFFAVMIGYFANLAVPRLGEVLKCTILARYEKVPADKLVGTIVAERAFDMVSLLSIFVLAFIFQYEIIGGYANKLVSDFLVSKEGSFSPLKISIAIAVVIGLFFLGRYIFKKYAHVRFIYLIKKSAEGIGHGIISVKDVKNKWVFIFYSVGIWALYLMGTWVGFYATIGTTGLGIEVALSALAFASVGMIVTPGGIGAYALFMAKVLEENGIPYELGFANGTLQWFAQFIIVVVLGFISLGLLPYFNKKKQTHAAN
jgi:glycosyltransferase 2 family protein